jgi:hypothetical protein
MSASRVKAAWLSRLSSLVASPCCNFSVRWTSSISPSSLHDEAVARQPPPLEAGSRCSARRVLLKKPGVGFVCHQFRVGAR